jgi:hypothetical protein
VLIRVFPWLITFLPENLNWTRRILYRLLISENHAKIYIISFQSLFELIDNIGF